MNWMRSGGAVAIAVFFTLTPACGDSEGGTETSTTEGPSTSPTGTSMGSTTAGTAGTAGTDGTAGTETGGTMGSTGSSGTESTSDPTTSPTTTANPTTDPTDPTDPTGGGDMFCLEQCQGDSDCLVDGEDLNFKCTDGVCQGESNGSCQGDMECQVLYSGWEFGDACGAQADCAVTQGCISLNGSGHCVYVPSDFIQCETLNMVEIQMPAIEGGTIIVCGNNTAICSEQDGFSFCVEPCMSDLDCPSQFASSCNQQTGVCGCGSDAECGLIDGYSICDAGQCKCGSDADCAELGFADVCHDDGTCGCSGDAVCSNLDPSFDGTVPACLSL